MNPLSSSGPPAKKVRLNTNFPDSKRTTLGNLVASRTTNSSPANKKPPLHSGRWTPEEEAYFEGMIVEFNAGLLPIAEGTTLRSFLAKMLNCNPKRVSKKYDGNKIYNGKSAYARAKSPLPSADACLRQENLLELERKFREALSTMQRVESRLQTLTGGNYPASNAAAAASANGSNKIPVINVYPSSSAVSSLTTDEEEAYAPMEQTPTSNKRATKRGIARVDETSVAQVSQCMETCGSSGNESNAAPLDRKPAAATKSSVSGAVATSSVDEAAASQMLLQLRSRSHVAAPQVAPPQQLQQQQQQPPVQQHPTSQVVPGTSISRDESFNGDLILQDLHQSQARDVLAAASSSADPKSGTDANGNVTLQNLLKNLQALQQQQHPQPIAAPAAPPQNLQEFLARSMPAQQPVQQQQQQSNNAGDGLQDFLQSMQKNHCAPSTGQSATDALLRQLTGNCQQQQQPQQQMPSRPLDLESMLRTLQQQNAQPVQQPKSDMEEFAKTFLQQANTNSIQHQPQPKPASVSLAANGKSTLSNILNKIVSGSSSAAPATVPPPMSQNNMQSILQGLLQSTQTQTQQVAQAPVNNMQSFMNALSNQQAAAPQQQQQQQPNMENAMSSMMKQLQQQMEQQQPRQQQQQPSNLQSLLESMGAFQSQQQAPKPVVNNTNVNEAQQTLQKWLAQLQQPQQLQ